MKYILSFLSVLLVSASVMGQSLSKAVIQKHENGKSKLVNFYKGQKIEANLRKQEHYAYDGQKTKEIHFLNGKRNGQYLEWKEFDGTPKAELNYKEGKLDGPQKQFFSDGRVKFELNYIDGKLNGRQVEHWFKAGGDTIRSEHNYSGGVLHGMQRRWNKENKLEYNYNFVAGKPDGIQRRYDSEGKVTQTQWKMGVLHEDLEFYIASKPKHSRIYDFKLEGDSLNLELGKKLQKEVFYFESGALQAITTGESPGDTQEFHPNSKVKGKGKGTIDKRQGVWEFWHVNGKKMMTGTYKDGKKTGLFQSWNEDEQMTSEEVWTADGARRESWKVYFYHKNGKKQADGFLDEQGRKKGLWKHWHENGNKHIEAEWEMACDGGGGRPFATSYKEWDETGKQTVKGNEGDQEHIAYYEDGTTREIVTALYGNRKPCSAKAVEIYEDGRIKRQVATALYEQHVVLQKVSFSQTGDTLQVDRWDVNGKRNGNQRGWYENGKEHYIYHYRNGGVQGTVKEWYPDGSPMLNHKYKSAEGGPPKLVEGTYYNDKGKDYFYSDNSGKDKKKQMLEIEENCHFLKFVRENQ